MERLTAGCPRCREPRDREPGPDCAGHGAGPVLWRAEEASYDAFVAHLATARDFPTYLPWPMAPGWAVSDFAVVTETSGVPLATLTCVSGTSELDGPVDALLVAEEPGVGLGARLAGGNGLDPGDVTQGPPDAKVEAAHHPTALWRCDSAEDRVAFVGEALGLWLHAVLWPPAAELVLLEHVQLHDLRHESHAGLELPVGAPTSRLG